MLAPRLQALVDTAQGHEQLSLPVPTHVLHEEAADLASFVRRYWVATDDLPGLQHVGPQLPASVADDLIALIAAAQDQDRAYRLAKTHAEDEVDLERARAVLREVATALRFAFARASHDARQLRQAQLAAVSKLYPKRSRSIAALSTTLLDHAGLADAHRDTLAQLYGFDVALIDEARTLGNGLRGRASRRMTRNQAGKHYRDRRNRILAVQYGLMREVRAVVRFVFREHPKVVAESTSAYTRRARRTQAVRRHASPSIREHAPQDVVRVPPRRGSNA